MEYTFRLPPDGESGFLFGVQADSDDEAVAKARRLLQLNSHDGDIHVDLTLGLTFGRVTFSEADVSHAAIVRRQALSDNPQHF